MLIFNILAENLKTSLIVKTHFLFAFLFLMISLVSCSPESSSSSSSSNNSNNLGNFSIDGFEATSPTATAVISDNSIAVTLTADNDDELVIKFNRYGDFLSATLNKPDLTTYSSYPYYAANYFSFNLESFDDSTRRAKGSFSGKVYLNNGSLTAPYKTVSGTFEVSCRQVLPAVAGLGASCVINDSQWHHTDSWRDEVGSEFIYKWISDDPYMILTSINGSATLGTFSFVPGSANRFQLAKFDTTTLQYIYYNCTGSYTISSNYLYNEFLGQKLVSGTFSFTAVNPADSADQIVVNNGTFKQIF